jgi:bifunctional non-homologous end joining protein LigD
VIHEHHARRLHWDLRLEHEGVLASFAIPRGIPTDPQRNNLAVHTEDHPIEYLTFSGTIPKGEYGAGEMFIWDTGTYELEKWKDGKEIVVILTGQKGGGLEGISDGKPVRLALIQTGSSDGKDNWLAHLMKDQTKGHWRNDARQHKEAAAKGGPAPSPMLAQIGTPGLVRGDDWALEMKWDGVRAIVDARGPLKLISRRGLDTTGTYPELSGLADLGPAILDGEIVAMDLKGRPSFSRLQQRMGLTDSTDVAAARRNYPVRIILFDLLEFEGRDLRGLPFRERREALETLAGGDLPENVDLSPIFDGDIDDVLEASAEHGLEGVMAKRLSSRYEAGKRSSAWLKIKHERTQEVVIGGWRSGKGGREGTIGSLLLGIPDDGGGLRYAGRVGTGFSERDLAEIASKLHRIERKTSPFEDIPREDTADAHWVQPKFVGEVRYGEWTDAGRLRHPVWRGWRPDKEPADVRVEA